MPVEIDSNQKIAVLLPCYNEAGAIGQTVAAFRAALPTADIYVYDNNSTDTTAAEAVEAGAIVRREIQQGKGHVVRRMFADVDADIYIMADGDGTYDAQVAPSMITRLEKDRLDMLVGTRVAEDGHETYRSGHRFGNRVLTGMAHYFFGRGFTDILSGYRVFSRRFVKSFPVASGGFEIETEITIHALSLSMPVGEMETRYFERAGETVSKLNTWRDGWRILMTMVRLFKDFKPLKFFGIWSLLLLVASVWLAVPLVSEYQATGLVPRFPTAILCTGMILAALLSLACGLILDSVAWQRLEAKRLTWLGMTR